MLSQRKNNFSYKNVEIYLSTFVNDLENEEASKIWIKQIISKNYTSIELLRITLCLIGRWSGHQLPWENLGLELGFLDVLPCFRSLICYLSNGQKSQGLVLGLSKSQGAFQGDWSIRPLICSWEEMNQWARSSSTRPRGPCLDWCQVSSLLPMYF